MWFSRNWRADTLTLTVIGGRPACCHALFWRQASRKAQSPIGTMSPVSSAIGMNLSGGSQAEPRVTPADQRLDREHRAAAQIDLRLIVQDEIPARNGVAQFFEQQQALVQAALISGV